MAPAPAPEGSPAARFAGLLRHHMDVGTRPTGRRGTGAWTLDKLVGVGVALSQRTLDNYRNGSTRPGDVSGYAEAFFGDDPRHSIKRNAFLIAFAEATGTEPPPWAFAISNIPIRVPTHFLGREEPLMAIRTALGRYAGRVAITALHGLRGVGKTVLAAAYAERHRADYRATWWVRAQTEPTMSADLIAMGVRLRWITAEEKEEAGLAVVAERLQHEGEGILLIYDNALDARRLTPYLPRGGAAQVLITSNAHDWRGVAEPVKICLWPRTIGGDYLIARTARVAERDDAEALSETLGGLPLAHEQAAAYCERLNVTLAEYDRRFAMAPVRLLDDGRHAPADYHDGRTVAKTFSLAIEAAAKEHLAAELLIVHLALLAPEPIPLFLLHEGREALGQPLTALLAEDGVDEAIAALRAFALVDCEIISDERDPSVTTDTVRVHRLVREVAAARLAAEDRENARRALVAALAATYPGEVYSDPRTWTRARRLDALALALVRGEATLPESAETQAIFLLDRIASYRQGALGAYAQARPLFERALAICEKAFGPEHPDTATSVNNLALLIRDQGDFAGARSLYERALAIREKTLGLEHLYTAKSFNNLAGLLQDQGDLSGARPLFRRALAIRRKMLGPEHPDTATCLNNLARLLRKQSHLARARVLSERALAIREKALGPEHPDTAKSLNDLAGLLQDQGNLSGARLLFRRALAIYRKVLGPEHPDTATCLNNLARLLRKQSHLARARPFSERALAIRKKALGPEHPDTATSLNDLAGLLQDQGDLSGAWLLFRRALAIREKTLGQDHPDTATSLNNLDIMRKIYGDLLADC